MVAPAPKPSMRQIAAQAGVSVVAVSCALRGGPGVSEDTRSRIRTIAESLGYRPDPLLSHLMYHLRSKRQPKGKHNIAFLHWPRDSYRDLVLDGARRRAEQNGYHLDVIRMTGEASHPRVLQRMLNARGIAGLVLGPSPMRDFSGLLDWENFSTVLTSHSVISPGFHRVVPNQYSATRRALLELARRGYKRIALVSPPWVDEDIQSLPSAALVWQAAQWQTTPLLCQYDPEVDSPAQLREWCQKNKPDAVVLGVSLDFEKVLCAALGREHASRLGIVSLGCERGLPNTAIVDYRPSMLGELAVDQLINQLHRGDRGIPSVQQTLTVEGELVVASAA